MVRRSLEGVGCKFDVDENLWNEIRKLCKNV